MKNLAKTKAEDDDGSEYYEYVKVGDDHYGYAAAYGMLARKIFYEERPQSGSNVGPLDIVGTTIRL